MKKITKKEMEYQIVLAEEKAYLDLKKYELEASPTARAGWIRWREEDRHYADLQSQWWAIHLLRHSIGLDTDVYSRAAAAGRPEYEELAEVVARRDAVTAKLYRSRLFTAGKK